MTLLIIRCRDEWISGAAGLRRYLIHAAPPRFIARVVAVDAETGHARTEELPADLATGAVIDADGVTLCEVDWIDPAPADADELLALLSRAMERVR